LSPDAFGRARREDVGVGAGENRRDAACFRSFYPLDRHAGIR
jgi:hypothetical protein